MSPRFFVWYRFRLVGQVALFGTAEVGRVYRLLGMVSHVCPGHGQVHLLFASAAEIGFLLILPGLGLVCLSLVTLLVLINVFVLLSFMLGDVRLQLVFVVGLVLGMVNSFGFSWLFAAPCFFSCLRKR